MLDLVFKDNHGFYNYGIEHFLCLLVLAICGVFIIYKARNTWSERQQRLYITILCIVGAFFQIMKAVIKSDLGIFHASEDLPFHLCNVLSLLMPFVMWFKSRKLWGVFFFWIMVGAFQSMITTTLTESLPHYEAIRFWTVHGFVSIAAIYGVFVYGFRLTYQDAIKSLIGLHVLAGFICLVNYLLDANYMYLRAKPAGANLFSLMGPWPWYILSLELVAIVFWGLILVPFYVFPDKRKS